MNDYNKDGPTFLFVYIEILSKCKRFFFYIVVIIFKVMKSNIEYCCNLITILERHFISFLQKIASLVIKLETVPYEIKLLRILATEIYILQSTKLYKAMYKKYTPAWFEEAFTQNRGRMVWHNPHSLVQTECECGPRTIISIWKVCKAIRNKVSITNCISEATWSHITEEEYDSTTVRTAVADLINGHSSPAMTSQSITFRKRGEKVVAGKTEKGRKRKHKRISQKKGAKEEN